MRLTETEKEGFLESEKYISPNQRNTIIQTGGFIFGIKYCDMPMGIERPPCARSVLIQLRCLLIQSNGLPLSASDQPTVNEQSSSNIVKRSAIQSILPSASCSSIFLRLLHWSRSTTDLKVVFGECDYFYTSIINTKAKSNLWMSWVSSNFAHNQLFLCFSLTTILILYL